MTKRVKVLLFSLIIMVAALCLNTTDAAVYNNFIYEVYDNEVVITGYEGKKEVKGDLIIPSEIEGMPVTEIGGMAFCGATFDGNLTLPSTLKVIGEYAFESSNITGKLILPNSLRNIVDNAFAHCKGLVGDLIIPEGVINIWPSAFEGCTGFNGSLTFPTTLIEIGDSAFSGCNGFTGSLTIPGNVKIIGGEAFKNCTAFTGDLIISNGVSEIGQSAFQGCSGFKGNLMLPDTLKHISISAFSGCSGFTGDLILPSDVTNINSETFKGCSGFNGKLVLPTKLTTIEPFAFYGCSRLTGDLIIPEGVKRIYSDAFRGCSGFDGKLTLPSTLVHIYEGAFYGCNFAGDIILPYNAKDTVIADVFEGNINALITLAGILIWEPAGETSITWKTEEAYTGQPITKEIYIDDLKNGVDYTVEYLNNVNPGKATVRVKGLGNYIGTTERTFDIFCNMPDVVVDEIENQEFTGYAYTPKPIVKLKDGQILEEGVDYTLEYTNNTYPGKATITITGIGDYRGTKEVSFYIIADINLVAIEEIRPQGYTGKPIKPVLSVKFGFNQLLRDRDYIIEDIDNTEMGEATVRMVGIGGYKGTRNLSFEIVRGGVSSFAIELINKEEKHIYDGTPKEPKIKVNNYDLELVEGVDYKVSYSDNINVGYGNIIVEGIGKYEGTRVYTFEIESASILDLKIANKQEYTEGVTQAYLLLEDGTAIFEGKDYMAGAIDNSTFGAKTIEIRGMGNYTGTRIITFELVKGNLAYCKFNPGEGPASVLYNTKPHEYKVPIYSTNNILLKENEDYVISYKNNVHAGWAEIVYTGIGKYEGETSFGFYIDPATIGRIEIDTNSVKYDGEQHRPKAKVYMKNYYGEEILLTEGVDYKLSYSEDLVNAGTVIITATGINSCKGSVNASFTIETVDVSELEVEGIDTEYNYIKGGINPKPVIKYNGKVLVENEDYYLSVIESKASGTVNIWLIGNYSGNKDFTYNIKPTDINDLTFEKLPDIVYGNPLKAEDIVIYHNGIRLEPDHDFYWSQMTNNKLGIVKITVFGTGDNQGGGYLGSVDLTYKVGYDINKINVTGVTDKVYTGSNITQSITVKYGKTILKLGTDYAVSYKNNIDLGEATLVITGKGKYIGTKEFKFNIVKRDVATFTYSKISDYAYTGSEIRPGITVSYGKTTLVKDRDYTVAYQSNINAGTGKIVITGIGNYTGTKIIKFNIVGRSVKSTTITGLVVKYYTGSKLTQDLKLTYNGVELVEGTDYTLTYKNNVAVGIASVTITGKGNFRSSITLDYKKKRKDIKGLEATCTESMAYNGGYRNAAVTLKDGETVLRLNKDYKVAYKNNVYPGTATVVITGIGNYSGTKELTYNIIPRGISAVTMKGLAVKYYTGGARTQSLTLTYGKQKLKLNKDYTLTYENNVEVGIAKVIVKGIGNFQGETELLYKIKPRSVTELTFSKVKNYTYTGKEITPNVTIVHGKHTLEKDKDYTITYSRNVNVGTASITITGIGQYTGTKKITFKINRRGISAATVEGLAVKYYTGKGVKQNLTLTYNGTTLKYGTDYTLTYKNNVKVGIASVTITGKGNYTSSITLKYKIKAKDISDLDFTCTESMAYNGAARKATVTIKNNGVTLKLNRDYKLTYKNNVYPGTATVVITGIGSYTGTKELTYNIIPRGITAVTIKGLAVKYYTGEEVKQKLTLTYGKKVLKEGTDYTLTYENNVEPGIASVTVKGIGNFQGETVLQYKIKPVDINTLSYNKVTTQSYTGNEIIPSITVKNGTVELKEGTHYSIKYENNVKVGTAVITITGLGHYTGTKKIEFKIKKDEYYIKINVQANTVTIYRGPDSSNLKPVKAMVCSTGYATPKSGKYTIKSRWSWLKLVGNVYGQYCTQIVGDILFHSVPYKKKSPDALKYEEFDKLGTKASAGCIRLTVEDAKWIYDNIKKGVTVEFYNSSNPGPLGKPTVMKISNNVNRNWDPTDPNKNNPWHKETAE